MRSPIILVDRLIIDLGVGDLKLFWLEFEFVSFSSLNITTLLSESSRSLGYCLEGGDLRLFAY